LFTGGTGVRVIDAFAVDAHRTAFTEDLVACVRAGGTAPSTFAVVVTLTGEFGPASVGTRGRFEIRARCAVIFGAFCGDAFSIGADLAIFTNDPFAGEGRTDEVSPATLTIFLALTGTGFGCASVWACSRIEIGLGSTVVWGTGWGTAATGPTAHTGFTAGTFQL
jgi:hypothetical protein